MTFSAARQLFTKIGVEFFFDRLIDDKSKVDDGKLYAGIVGDGRLDRIAEDL